MNLHRARTLVNLATKPEASARTQLIATRMICRLYAADLDTLNAERRDLWRQARLARRFLPFTAAAVAALEQRAASHAEGLREALREALVGFGRVLLLDTDNLTEALGFDGLCDLLSINPVHREQARRDGGETVRGLVFIAGMEDSAQPRREGWGDGGPLFRACLLAACEFIRTTPHLLPDPFAPDGPFYGACQTLHHADGTTRIKRPDVTVHDSTGSRVVKR